MHARRARYPHAAPWRSCAPLPLARAPPLARRLSTRPPRLDSLPAPCAKGFKIEYAKSNRAGCKGCKEKIGMNELRLGKLVPSPHFDGYVSFARARFTVTDTPPWRRGPTRLLLCAALRVPTKIDSVLTCACAVCSNRCGYVSGWVIVLAANCLPAAATAPAAHQDACTRLRAILGDTCRE